MKRPPRVALLAPRKPGDGLGGAEQHLALLRRVLEDLGAVVECLSHSDAGPAGWCGRIAMRATPLLASPLATRRLVRGRRVDADIVLSVELMGFGLRHPRHLHLFFGSYAGFRADALSPVAGLSAFPRGGVTALARFLENRTQGRDGAVANSEGLRDRMRRAGVRVRDEVVLPPVDTDLFRPGDVQTARRALGMSDDRRLVLFAGRWEYAKGADRFERLLRCLPRGWAALLACPSKSSEQVPSGVPIRILTDVPHERMVDVYRASDVLIQPSRFEGYSLVAGEAQACGRPVLTAPVGHAAHFRRGDPLVRAGVVDNADAPRAWLDALGAVAGSEERWRAASRAAREHAESTVALGVVARDWHKLLSKVYPEFEWRPPR